MENINWHEMDNETLQEHEDLLSAEIGDITTVQIAYPAIVPLSVLNLIAERHAKLEKAWFEVTTEMRDRGLNFLNPADE